MAQFNFAEKSEIEELHIEPTDVMTGDRNKSRYLLYQLKLSIARAKQIDIIVSFLMESGVRMLLSDLKAALQRGVRIRILTGNYLGITQPSALYLLKKELGDKVELRFYSDKGRSFHPKSYIFHYDNMSEIYIGSSNISRSALTSGIEWNYRFNNNQDSQNFKLFYETFEDLFKNHDEDNLVLYEKYSRKDVCRILNWEHDDSSTVYGYRIKHNTCPIFVTYEKKDDIANSTKYEDQFINNQLFSWMTRSKVSLESPESQKIINYSKIGLKIYLFIKKSDGEGTDFYYMGKVSPIDYMQTEIENDNGQKLPIMNFKMKLEHSS